MNDVMDQNQDRHAKNRRAGHPAVRISGTGLAGLAGMLGAGNTQLTPEQAQQLSPEAVQQLGGHAEKANPSVIDSISNFYAQHTTLVKTLGGAALTVALAKVAERQRQA